MGYCYEGRKLCCDGCGVAGGVRKRRCPYGYCPAAALCNACYKTKRVEHAAYHATNCARQSAEYKAQLARTAARKAAGEYLRCSAASDFYRERTPETAVHVLFSTHDGTCVGRFMSHDTYDSISLGADATPEDYAKFGAVVDAPSVFSNGTTSKQTTARLS